MPEEQGPNGYTRFRKAVLTSPALVPTVLLTIVLVATGNTLLLASGYREGGAIFALILVVGSGLFVLRQRAKLISTEEANHLDRSQKGAKE